MNLKGALKGKLTKKELGLLKTSFDIIGSVAILEIPDDLEKKEKVIAQALLSMHKNIKAVCKKVGERKGLYRLRKYKKILGKGFETIHTESGCRFKIDIRKAYFSVRESTERLRIAGQTKVEDSVLVLFSGIGPFGIILSKKTGCIADMVEVNPKACEYAEENIRLNKVQDKVKNFCGNAEKVSEGLGKYDKILMPLPETAYKFLSLSAKHLKKGGTVYLYAISGKEKRDVEKEINKNKLKIISQRNVLPYAPGVWKVCFELKPI